MTTPVSAAASTGRVQAAIARAAGATGVDFGYLLGQARLESGLDAGARAATSTASGLYQFIDQSWLAAVKKHGAEHGLGWAAAAIQPGANGRLTVADPAARQAVLALRDDPAAAASMAAASAADHAEALGAALGRAATGTDLYMAHFLGLAGATRFLTAMGASPGASGAALFPAAAASNRGVFYAADGSARSLADIYARFAGKLGDAGAAAPTAGYRYAAQALDTGDGTTVVTGAGESASAALAWARGATGAGARPGYASLLRPAPDTARLAYLMLARMGG